MPGGEVLDLIPLRDFNRVIVPPTCARWSMMQLVLLLHYYIMYLFRNTPRAGGFFLSLAGVVISWGCGCGTGAWGGGGGGGGWGGLVVNEDCDYSDRPAGDLFCMACRDSQPGGTRRGGQRGQRHASLRRGRGGTDFSMYFQSQRRLRPGWL